jgi:hypothetical protein
MGHLLFFVISPLPQTNIRLYCLLHFVAFFHVASLFSAGVDNEKVGVDKEKALGLKTALFFT